MKKVVIGCLGVVLLLAVGGSIVAYLFVVKPGMEIYAEVTELGQEFEQANENIENTASYTPPANEELTQDLVDRYLEAQRAIRASMGTRLQELEEKYKRFDQSGDGGGEQAGITDVIGAYGDIFGLLAEAKRAQVDAINAQNFSLEEYTWTRNKVYQALGQEVGMISFGQDFDLEQLMNAEPDNQPGQQAPEANIELVQPHREELMEMIGLAWFGL